MADFEEIRRTLAEATAEAERLRRQLVDRSTAVAAERARLARLQAEADREAVDAAAARIGQMADERAALARALGGLHDRVRRDLDGRLGRVLDLEADVPLVLLPVRVEVRSTAAGAALRVRIFHDALHVETLDEGISEAERSAGIAYWTTVWASGDTATPWPGLVAATGRRAAWVAEALRPTNLASAPSAVPNFPATAARRSRPAVARTLPDRFFVRVEQDGAAPVTHSGNAIPDELPVGLADRDEFTRLELAGRDLPPIDESLRWMIDYDTAVDVGMALTVPLARPGQPVRRLLVYGVRAAVDRTASAARLERLIRSHRFTDGAEFLAQGTPTNNTDAVRTEWSLRTPPGPPAISPPVALDAGANAAVTARAFGLGLSVLGALPGAADRQQARAAAFNTALWTTTWGDAIEHITPAGRANGDQRLDSPSLDAVRRHWVDYVRGRGPLPVLRLGRQPYGLLPIVATDASWRPLRGGFVENRLVPFIDQQVRWMWNTALANVRSVMTEPLDTALPAILGTDAVLRGLRVRTALSPEPFVQGAMALTLPDLGDTKSQQQVTSAVLILSGVSPDAITEHELLGTKTRSLALPLVHESDPAFVRGLLQPEPPAVPAESVLQVLLAHAAEVDRHTSASIATLQMHGVLREAIASNTVGVDGDLTTRAFDAVVAQRSGGALAASRETLVADAAAHVAARAGRLDTRILADRHPFPAIAPATVAQQIGGPELRVERLTGADGMQLIGEFFARANWSAAVRTALEDIARIESLDERRLLLCETLDCCSHRLDAWITATAARRLSDVRDGAPSGAFIGAYGWLEGIELRTPAAAGTVDGTAVLHDGSDGGYIHAPGLTHAVAAGILRSGRLTHRRGDPNSEALEIDLSSARVRDALALLDGMRRGQPLGALLGYRLERRLHERSGNGVELDRFIYVLRALAPLRGGKLSDPGQAVEESLAASDVVDGLRLMTVPVADVKQKMQDGPEDAAYIPAGSWVRATDDEVKAVLAAIAELDETHDAVADLLLAESVYQLAAGNPARAAAALDVLGAGEATPPEPEVIRTPRSGVPIQHRLAILVPDPVPPALPGWNVHAPRAQAEPRLERWAQGAFGAATAIDVTADGRVTLDAAGFCALDLLYDADGDSVARSTLASRLRTIVEDGEETFSTLAPVWELAGLLRAMVIAGHPLDVASVGRPVEDGAIGRRPDTEELIARAAAAIEGLTNAIDGGGTLDLLAPYGVRRAPGEKTLAASAAETAAAHDALAAAAGERIAEAESLLARARGTGADQGRVELASQALAVVFGSSFVVVPRLLPPPAGEADLWTGAVGAGGVNPPAGAHIRPWLARAGALRAAAAAYGETVLVREARGRRPRLRVIQTPAGAYPAWAALPFDGAPPTVPLASMVAEVTGAEAGQPVPSLAGGIAGIVLDDWVEVVPRRLPRWEDGDRDAAPTFHDVTSTGIAINANAPGARPPQAMLLALSADGARWTGDRLVTLLDEAITLARMRTLTLQEIPFIGRVLPALYFRDWSLQGEPVIDWLQVATKFDLNDTMKFLAVEEDG
ncbi:MAG TPA: hypothetical protein VFK57_18950 [Vicinamibacterales bacterium]|nr:hypothetical protein [Vicinamibacterales bacterium]